MNLIGRINAIPVPSWDFPFGCLATAHQLLPGLVCMEAFHSNHYHGNCFQGYSHFGV